MSSGGLCTRRDSRSCIPRVFSHNGAFEHAVVLVPVPGSHAIPTNDGSCLKKRGLFFALLFLSVGAVQLGRLPLPPVHVHLHGHLRLWRSTAMVSTKARCAWDFLQSACPTSPQHEKKRRSCG